MKSLVLVSMVAIVEILRIFPARSLKKIKNAKK